ncbi:MAG: sugar transporter [Bacteroidales bacterium]|nr:sugar transporter [Bacteroidales bacterium]
MAGRASNSILNAKVNVLFYFLSLFFSFFTRKIFLDCLGEEFIGLTGTLGSILGYLNLAELGISSCICFFLYKPLQEGDREKTQEVMSLMGYLYRTIGLFVLSAGVLISLSFPFVFTDTGLSLFFIYFAYYSFLGSSLVGYFINYRQILLTADQKEYLISMYMQTATLVKIGIQIALAYYLKNIYLWTITEFLFGLFACIFLNVKINKEYPWLKADKSKGKALLKKYPEVLKNVKQIFIHKIKDFLLGRSDELFIFIFVSLEMVARYGNYTMIIQKIAVLFNTALNSVSASIGNLVAEGDKKKLISVFWEMMSLRHFASGFLAFGVLNLIEPFIIIWLGDEKYIIGREVLILLIVFFYIENTKRVVDMYNYAHGLYSDTWAAWAELILNISIILVAGHFWGIAGILTGKVVSMTCISVFWKPYFLFSQGLKMPVSIYWKGTVPLFVLTIGTVIGCTYVCQWIPLNPSESIWQWIAYSATSIVFYLVVSGVIYYFFAKGAKEFAIRMKQRFIK